MIITPSSSTALRLQTGQLVLVPDDAQRSPARAALVRALQDAGLIEAPMAQDGKSFLSGPELFALIAFTGCAVTLDTSETATPGLEVSIEGPLEKPQLRTGRNTRPPRCPDCGAPARNWRSQLSRAGQTEAGLGLDAALRRMHCANCGASATSCSWRWGRHAGCGSCFVSLTPVFPGEGQPLPAIFAVLDALDSGTWHHFYLQPEGPATTAPSSTQRAAPDKR